MKMFMMTRMRIFMAQNKLPRRAVLSGIVAALLWSGLPAYALTNSAAKTLINQAVDDINAMVASTDDEEIILAEFEKIFERYADVNLIARYALGAEARRATPKQMKKFTRVFKIYMARKYGSRFREFMGSDIIVKDSKKVKSFYKVTAEAKLQNANPFEVEFLVSDKSGKPLFFNIFIEGINMLLSERAEIGALLDKNGGKIDRLITALEATL